jgi:fumarate reductase subunit C
MVQIISHAARKQVTAMPQYSQYQPKAYKPKMSAYWWLDQWHYLRYALREASSFFVGYFAVITLIQIAALDSGPGKYAAFQAWMRSPLLIVVNAIALAFLLFHAVTWFNLVPRVMVRQIAGRPMPDAVSSIPNFFIWFGATVIVALFILRLI